MALYVGSGIDLRIANCVADFILDGKWQHQALQVVGNGKTPTNQEIIQQVKDFLPANAEICVIVKVYGDYEMSELDAMADSMPIFKAERPKTECIFLDDKYCRNQ